MCFRWSLWTGRKFSLFSSYFEGEKKVGKSHNEEIEEMENFVFGIFPISRSPTHFHPLTSAEKQTQNFRYYLFCFIVVVAWWNFTKCSLVTGSIRSGLEFTFIAIEILIRYLFRAVSGEGRSREVGQSKWLKVSQGTKLNNHSSLWRFETLVFGANYTDYYVST